MALTQPRNTLARHSGRWTYPLAAGVKIYQGGMVALKAGYAIPGKTEAGLVALGRAEETVDNTNGAAGDVSVPAERGTFYYANAAADPVTQADVGKQAYIVDDETVAKTSDTDKRSPAGTVRAVDAGGVWIEF